MSSHNVIALVSAALRDVIEAGLGEAAPDAAVRIGPPGGGEAEAEEVSLCLYRVSQLPRLANDDLPTRQPDGRLTGRARAAIALHYFLAFNAPDDLRAQLLMGKVASILHAVPALTADQVARTLSSNAHPALAGLSAPDPWTPVRLVAASASAEDLHALWTAFGGAPRATLHYEASPVLIDADMGSDPAP